MAGIKKLITGIIIGLLVGLWFGVNIGKGRPIWANPFAEEKDQLIQQSKDKANEVIKDAKKALRDKLEDEEKK